MSKITKFEDFNVQENLEAGNETAINEAEWMKTIMDMLNDGTMVYVAGEAIAKGVMLKAMISTFLGIGAMGVAPAIAKFLKDKKDDFMEIADKIIHAGDDDHIHA